eukprot:jgi/Tetstr1/434860/TSEL_002574.t1
MRTQLSPPVQFGGLGIGDNVVFADASHIGAAALVVGQAVAFLRAQHATLSDAGAFLSEPSGVSSPHSLYLVWASSIHKALATPALAPDAVANVSAPIWVVELRAAHTRVIDECGDGVLEDLAGPLASDLKLLPSKRSHIARAGGYSAAGPEPASAMRSAVDLQAIPRYSDFPLHSMRKVQETLSHRIHTVRFAKLAARMPTSGPDRNPFRGLLFRATTAFLVTDPPTWAVTYANNVARCYGGDSNHTAHEWAAHGLSDVCHDVKSTMGVVVQILTDPSVFVSLPKGSDGRPVDVGLFGYGGIRGNTVAVDTTIDPILGVSSSDPTTALRFNGPSIDTISKIREKLAPGGFRTPADDPAQDGAVYLGAPISHYPEWMTGALGRRREAHATLLERIASFGTSGYGCHHGAMRLLVVCAVRQTGFLSRMMPPPELDPFLAAVDAANISVAFSLLGLDACDQSTPRMEAAIVQMSMPADFGGLNLALLQSEAPAAFYSAQSVVLPKLVREYGPALGPLYEAVRAEVSSVATSALPWARETRRVYETLPTYWCNGLAT